MYRPIARQRLGKNIPVGANARSNRTSIARQWKTVGVFHGGSAGGYITRSSIGAGSCGQELGRVLEMAV
jgi:hypothetical protein